MRSLSVEPLIDANESIRAGMAGRMESLGLNCEFGAVQRQFLTHAVKDVELKFEPWFKIIEAAYFLYTRQP
jgi:hypothetical protein